MCFSKHDDIASFHRKHPNYNEGADLVASDGQAKSDIIMVQAFGLKPDFVDFEYTCSNSNTTIEASILVVRSKSQFD